MAVFGTWVDDVAMHSANLIAAPAPTSTEPSPQPNGPISHRTLSRMARRSAAALAMLVASSGCAAAAAAPAGGSAAATAGGGAPVSPATECTVAKGTAMPKLISTVFTCELIGLGVPKSVAATAAKEADRVAWCESRFDPNAVAYDGKYVNTPHPMTGYRYSAAGLFQIIRSTADAYVPGGYAAVKDPVANTRGAAIIWEWGWSRGRDPWKWWVCKPGSAAELKAAAER